MLRATVVVALGTVGGAACLTSRAQTPAEHPALEVPAPPDRVIPQVPPPEPTPVIEPVDDLPTGTKPASSTRTNNKPPARPPAQDPPKPENKPDPPATETPAPVQNPPPAPQLKLPENTDAGVMSRQIRDTIERTRRMLGQTDRTKLTALRQKAFDDAQLFIKQAEDAVNAKNFVFAKELADKAERLAKEVQNR